MRVVNGIKMVKIPLLILFCKLFDSLKSRIPVKVEHCVGMRMRVGVSGEGEGEGEGVSGEGGGVSGEGEGVSGEPQHN